MVEHILNNGYRRDNLAKSLRSSSYVLKIGMQYTTTQFQSGEKSHATNGSSQ